jgi:hypothetical protein
MNFFSTGQQTDYYGRCASCHGSLDRAGKRCRSCFRRFQVKAFLALAAVGQICFMIYVFYGKPSWLASKSVSPSAQVFLPGTQSNGGWFYYDTVDESTHEPVRHARLQSNPPPRASSQNAVQSVVAGTLLVTASHREGDNITLTIPKTQTACNTSTCSVLVSFDETQPQEVPYRDLSTDTATVLLLDDYPGITEKLRLAEDLMIIARLGAPQQLLVNFSVAGFHLAPAGSNHSDALPIRAGSPYSRFALQTPAHLPL